MDEDVLFVFAHQDDEIGILTRLAWEVACGARVWCAYLTDGAAAVSASVRDAESRHVLTGQGVDPARIAFLGTPERIRDGTLPQFTAAALDSLRTWGASIPALARIYTLDWEGGHHDHDAAHVVASAYAAERDVDDVFAYSMYNGYRRRGWFRVTSLVPGSGEVVRRRLSLGEALLPVRAIASYPSQRRTWLGLGPELALRAIVRREERIRRVDPRRVRDRPHPGPLLYETMFHVPASTVLRATEALRARIAGA